MLTPLLLRALPRSAATPPEADAIMVVSGLMYILPAAWGVATGIDLLRLKKWARISTIVFSVLLTLMSLISGVATAFVPLPEDPRYPGVANVVRIGMEAFWAALLALGAWWLIYFTRPGVKAQFVSGEPRSAAPGRRPLSVTVIAGSFLASCLSLPYSLFVHSPFPLFLWVATGWTATVVVWVATAMYVATGVGLLRLRPAARLAAIGLTVFWTLSGAVFLLAPGRGERLQTYVHEVTRAIPGPQTFLLAEMGPFLAASLVFGLALVILTLYFLITRKRAFYPPPPEPAA